MSQQGQIKIIGNYSYNLKHCLGEGAYGKVYQGTDTTSNQKVAIKKLDLKNFERDTYLRNQIIQEIEILKKFNHKNIVRFIDLISTQRSLYIITEFCKDGDLRELMTRKKFSEQDSWKILRQINQGFKELVSNTVIHRDLKPANILSHEGIYKIADFGFAKYVDNFSNQLLRSCVGSPLYMAPQILARKPYSTKCDIWSLGIILYEMIFQDVPWKGRDERDLLKNILTVPLQWKKNGPTLTNKTEEFLRKSLTIEEGERMSWDKVFELFEITNEVQKIQSPFYQTTQQQQQQQQLQQQQQQQQYASNQSNSNNRKKSIFTQQVTIANNVGSGFQNVSPQPQIIVQVQPVVSLNHIKQQNLEIIFRNFVLTTELYSKYNQMRTQINQNGSLEKLMFALSKTNISMQMSLIQQCVMIQQLQYQNNLKRELEFYTQFNTELVDMMTRNGQIASCELQLEYLQVRDSNYQLNEQELDKAQLFINSTIKSVVQDMMDELKKSNNICRQNMLNLDNMIDLIGIHKKVQRQIEIDYDQLNADKAEEEDPRRFQDKIYEKLKAS